MMPERPRYTIEYRDRWIGEYRAYGPWFTMEWGDTPEEAAAAFRVHYMHGNGGCTTTRARITHVEIDGKRKRLRPAFVIL